MDMDINLYLLSFEFKTVNVLLFRQQNLIQRPPLS